MSGVVTAVRQLAISVRMSFVETTRELGFVLGFTIIFPIGILFFLNHLVAPDLRTQVLVGTVMMETALLNINVLAQAIGSDKQTRLFDLWVSLPVSPVVYALSVAVVLLPFTLISAAVTLGVAVAFFGVAVSTSTLVFLVAGFALVWASTMGIGYLIGVFGGTPRQINSNAQLVGVILTFFAPVFYPVSVLPAPLRAVAYAWPLTWGTQFLVGILQGAASTTLWSALVLVGFVILWLAIIGIGPRWRQV
ncbi:MAG TPA: ABC transporter permease [Thermoplasmata archaeon]|nr:ABC transporter permease [Thermoplasmata archaeon]